MYDDNEDTVLTHFKQIIKLIKLWGTKSDFLGHHTNLKTTFKCQIKNWF